MLSSIGFLLFGLFVLCGTVLMAKEIFFGEDPEIKASDFPVMAFGLLLGGVCVVLGSGGMYYASKFEPKPPRRLVGDPQPTETELAIKKIRRLMGGGVETTANVSSKLIIKNNVDYQNKRQRLHGPPKGPFDRLPDKIQVDTYTYRANGQELQMIVETNVGPTAIPALQPNDRTIRLVYLSSDPSIALPGTKQLLATELKRLESLRDSEKN